MNTGFVCVKSFSCTFFFLKCSDLTLEVVHNALLCPHVYSLQQSLSFPQTQLCLAHENPKPATQNQIFLGLIYLFLNIYFKQSVQKENSPFSIEYCSVICFLLFDLLFLVLLLSCGLALHREPEVSVHSPCNAV